MPWIIDYDTVVERLSSDGLKCNYYNSGAFSFAPEAGAAIRGWMGPDDQTIKPGARLLARQVAAPFEATLAALLRQAWEQFLAGPVWAMPVSHWAYELNFGSKDWMPALIENLDLDPGLLASRNNAAAIEFSIHEAAVFERFSRRLLEMLLGSDFMLVFPRRKTICTLHHHKQLWWVSADPTLIARLDGLLLPPANPADQSAAELKTDYF